MGADTRIEWAHHSFNPWIGCQHVSPACDHCYAEALSKVRLGVAWGPGAERRRTKPATWAQPRRWNREAARRGVRYRVFCASLADVFDNAVEPAWRRDLFALIGECPNLDWLLLTKRIGNAVDMLPTSHLKSPWPNVWLGATIVNQAEADRDIPKLLATPAAKRFLSMEPLLGPVDLRNLTIPRRYGSGLLDAFTLDFKNHYQEVIAGPPSGHGPLDQIIVGGETGLGARITPIRAVKSLRDQCAAAGVAFLYKQHGEWVHESQVGWLDPMTDIDNVRWELIDGESYYRVGKKAAGRLLDGVQHDGLPA